MKSRGKLIALFSILFWLISAHAMAGELRPLYGAMVIDGYDMGKDTSPSGAITYDEAKNVFVGSYSGLKMPPGKRAIFAWLHDTVNQKSTYLGAAGWLKNGTTGRDKGMLVVRVPDQYKGGKFGSNEIIGFTAEKTALFDGKKAVGKPASPSGSAIQKLLKPAFYLYSALPGADTNLIYCGHGKDFAYAKAPAKQTCYDCLCGQKYSACVAAGKVMHKSP